MGGTLQIDPNSDNMILNMILKWSPQFNSLRGLWIQGWWLNATAFNNILAVLALINKWLLVCFFWFWFQKHRTFPL
jgi:hypothetical protein